MLRLLLQLQFAAVTEAGIEFEVRKGRVGLLDKPPLRAVVCWRLNKERRLAVFGDFFKLSMGICLKGLVYSCWLVGQSHGTSEHRNGRACHSLACCVARRKRVVFDLKI